MALVPLNIRDGNGASQNQEMFQGVAGLGNNIPVVSLDSTRNMYRASASRAAVITTTTKTIVNIQGSATKTVRIMKIGIYLTAATAAEGVLQLQRTSTQGVGGTAVAPTVAKMDTNAAAATAVVQHFITAAQAQGTGVGGPITSLSFNEAVTTTAPTFFGAPTTFLWPECGVLAGQALVLRGTSDYIEIQTATAIGTTPALSYFVEWIEDNS